MHYADCRVMLHLRVAVQRSVTRTEWWHQHKVGLETLGHVSWHYSCLVPAGQDNM